MKSFHSLLLFVLLSFGIGALTACSVKKDDSDGTNVKGLVEAHMSAFEEAWTSGDGSKVGAFYAEDAVRIVFSMQTPLYGRDAISQNFSAGFSQDEGDPLLSLTLVEAREMGEGVIMAVGEWEAPNEGQGIRGAWLNVYRSDGQTLSSVFDHAVVYNPVTDLTQVERVFDEVHKGEGSDMVERAIARYTSLTNAGDIAGLSVQMFEEDGVQVTENGILKGHEALASGIQPPPEGVRLTAQSYGYRPVSDDLVINWGGYQIESSEGGLLSFGQWGNLLRVVDGELILVVEAAGAHSAD